MTGAFEFIGLLAAFAIFFVAIPAAVTNYSSQCQWYWRATAGFVTLSAFFTVSMMLLGFFGAGFPGIVVALWILWSIAHLVWSGGMRLADVKPRLEAGFLKLLRTIELKRLSEIELPTVQLSRTGVLAGILMAATALERVWFPLHNLRFSRMETYVRALDLQRFAHHDSVFADGAAYLLHPLGVFAGLYPDAVIRFSGPLFSVLLVIAVALCTLRYLESADAALIAAALVAVWPVVAGIRNPGELSSSEIAAVYWILAIACAGRSWYLTACAFGTALLVSWKMAPVLAVAGAAVPLAFGMIRLIQMAPQRFHVLLPGAVASVSALLLIAECGSPVDDGPFEYEAAARVSRNIAARFPRNQWLIVSPVQELAFTYGRGWHYELIDFVSSNSIDRIASPEFAFPYEVDDLFIFVEKQPLQGETTDAASGLNLTGSMDRAVLAYHTGLGRTSLEFQAAALLAAYQRNHRNISRYYEDTHLLVFRVQRDAAQEPSKLAWKLCGAGPCPAASQAAPRRTEGPPQRKAPPHLEGKRS